MTSLTPQQAQAITARDVSVALAAGAGCGKTFVLTERFLSCLDPQQPGGPLRLDQLTAITFTERAAREMRLRIRDACVKRLKAAADEHVVHWLRTIREIDSARIATIHSFCGTLLRSHAVEAGLDPRFQVLDAAATQTVLYELVDDQLRQRLAAGDEAVIDLVVNHSLPRLREMVARLLGERQQIDWDFWLGQTPDGLAALWEQYWRTDTRPRVLCRISKCAAAAKILQIVAAESPESAVMRERFELLGDRLPRLSAAAEPAAALEEIRLAAQVQGGGGKKGWSSVETYTAFRDAATELRGMIVKLKTFMTFDAEAARPAAVAALNLLSVTRGLATAYSQRKTELAALDFDDLLIHARDLIAGESQADLRKRLAAQNRLLLVDEFQDTDPLQVELVRALCDGRVTDGRLFFVGDAKQSIYRFRGADPHVFRCLRDEIPSAGRLPLTLNFRSQPGVIEFVNALFAEEMGNSYEPLAAHRRQLGPNPPVEFLWAIASQEEADQHARQQVLEEGDEGADRAEDESFDRARPNHDEDDTGSPIERNRRREAEWIARRLRGMLDGGERLVGDRDSAGEAVLRAARPGDICLLFRALTDVEYYEDALRRYGIDYYLVGGRAFYAQQEIYDIVNLLRAVASPCDELALAGTLRSPMFGLLDETLYWLSRHAGGLSGGFWGLAEGDGRLLDPITTEEQLRLRFAAETLGRLRAMKDRLPVARLLHEALALTGYDALLLAEFLGERKLANLHKLIEQARRFDAAGIFTLADFITQLAQFVARQPDEPMAATQPESVNAVRLMSIHQSKGLEFPVVVVVDVARSRRGSSEAVAFSRQLGPMVQCRDSIGGFDLFMQADLDEDLAEFTRLFYVATTRAADYLIVSSGLEDIGQSGGPWLELLRRRFDIETGAVEDDPRRLLAKVIHREPELPNTGALRAGRPDLRKAIDKARKLALAGGAGVPESLQPVPVDRAAQRRFSFSRLHGTMQDEAAEGAGLGSKDEKSAAAIFETSACDGGSTRTGELDPVELGILVHAVLADLAGGSDDRRATVEALVRKHASLLLPDAQGLDEPIDMVVQLASSPRWASMRAAARRYVELDFLLAWPPGNREAQAPRLQGVIDCLYEDGDGGWRLLDYKTNRISPATLAATVQTYEMQMYVYAAAVERIFKRPPVEIVLNFLRGGHEHRFAWDAVASQGMEDLVSRTIQQARGPA